MRTVAALLLTLCVFARPLPALVPAQDARGPEVRTVAILVYPGVELLDFSGPGEVFAAARASDGRRFRVITVAESKEPLVSQGFLTIVPQHSLADCPRPDIVVLPGGNVPTGRPAVVEWVRRVGSECEVALSVCNGALLLAKAGLLEGLEATTHHGSLRALALASPAIRVRPEKRFVDNGRVVTTAGVSAGIDGALHVVSRLLGHDAAARTADYMEYRWEPEAAEAYQRARNAAELEGTDALVELARVVQTEGVEAGLARWNAMEARPDEMEVNGAGYALLGSDGRAREALALFELNAAAHPESANVWDSLADAHEALGNQDDAVRCTRECLARIDAAEVDPGFRERIRQASSERLERLGAAPAGSSGASGWMCPPCPVDCHERVYERAGTCDQCGMALIPKNEYERRVGAQRELENGTSRAAAAPAAANEILTALEVGELRAEDLLGDPAVVAAMRDADVRRAVKAHLREHPAKASLALASAGEEGVRLALRVKIVAPETGEPLAGAHVYAYQTDATGIYSPPSEGGNDLPRIFGYALADERGELWISTIVPGSYPNSDINRHVHFEIRAAGRASAITEIGFADDPLMDATNRENFRRNGWPVVEPQRTESGGLRCEVVLGAGRLAP